jgi:hypothetical protein
MSRAIDFFVTYRFIKLLTTPFEKTEAYKLGIIDKKGFRSDKELLRADDKNAYTALHKLVFNIKRIFSKVPGLRSKIGTYAAALYLLKDTFKEDFNNHDMLERELVTYLLENNIKLDACINEEINLEDGKLPKGIYHLTSSIMIDDETDAEAEEGDEVEAFDNVVPEDNIMGMDIYSVIHTQTRSKIFVSLDDITKPDLEDLL